GRPGARRAGPVRGHRAGTHGDARAGRSRREAEPARGPRRGGGGALVTSDSPTVLDRSGYELELDDAFGGPELDRARWLPAYLPQWSSRVAAAARYTVGPDGLVLRIDPDQAPWAPEWNGGLRISSLQTGVRSGP